MTLTREEMKGMLEEIARGEGGATARIQAMKMLLKMEEEGDDVPEDDLEALLAR